MGTGAASLYKVYKWLLNYPGTECCKRPQERIRVPGLRLIPINGSNPAKSMTNNLPLLSVLAGVLFIYPVG
jgi:hypothetical protein